MAWKGCSLRTRSYMNRPQTLEIRKDNISNALTGVPKDYLIVSSQIKSINIHITNKEYQRKWYKKNRKHCNAKSKQWYKNNRERGKEIILKAHHKVRKETITHYGGLCACCNEDNIAFLCLDHIKGGGGKQRKQLKKNGGSGFYFWLRKNDYPKGYQILCYNCNNAKAKYGQCPHQSN